LVAEFPDPACPDTDLPKILSFYRQVLIPTATNLCAEYQRKMHNRVHKRVTTGTSVAFRRAKELHPMRRVYGHPPVHGVHIGMHLNSRY
jgi:hypothetical protein